MLEGGWGLDLPCWEGGWDVVKKRSSRDENVDDCAEERAEDVEVGFFIKKDDGLEKEKESTECNPLEKIAEP